MKKSVPWLLATCLILLAVSAPHAQEEKQGKPAILFPDSGSAALPPAKQPESAEPAAKPQKGHAADGRQKSERNASAVATPSAGPAAEANSAVAPSDPETTGATAKIPPASHPIRKHAVAPRPPEKDAATVTNPETARNSVLPPRTATAEREPEPPAAVQPSAGDPGRRSRSERDRATREVPPDGAAGHSATPRSTVKDEAALNTARAYDQALRAHPRPTPAETATAPEGRSVPKAEPMPSGAADEPPPRRFDGPVVAEPVGPMRRRLPPELADDFAGPPDGLPPRFGFRGGPPVGYPGFRGVPYPHGGPAGPGFPFFGFGR